MCGLTLSIVLRAQRKSRYRSMIQKTILLLVDTAIFVSISTSTAGIYYSQLSTTLYELHLAAHFSTLAFSSLLLLYIFGRTSPQPKWRAASRLILVVLAWILAFTGERMWNKEVNRSPLLFEDFFCFTSLVSWLDYTTMPFVFIFMPFACATLVYGLATLFSTTRRMNTLIGIVPLFLFSFVSIWTELGIIFILRSRLKSSVGDTYGENSWGYGQILPLFIWMPAFIELLNSACVSIPVKTREGG